MGICVLSPAHESEMRGYFFLTADRKILSHWFCLNSATVCKTGRPYRGIFCDFFQTFLEEFVDHVFYRDYIVTRRPSLSCFFLTVVWSLTEPHSQWACRMLRVKVITSLAVGFFLCIPQPAGGRLKVIRSRGVWLISVCCSLLQVG